MSATRDVPGSPRTSWSGMWFNQSHKLTPEFSAKLFAQKGIGAFWFSAALIKWSQGELESLRKILVQAYRNAWYVPCSLYTLPVTIAEGGHECPLPSGILMQTLLQHVDQCMRYENALKQIMLPHLARTLKEWHCKWFAVLIDKMVLWAHKHLAHKDFWSRLANSLHIEKLSFTWAEQMDKNSLLCSS